MGAADKLARDFLEMAKYGKHIGRLDTLNEVLDILADEHLYSAPVYSRIRKLVDETLGRKHKEAA